jgi:hypothetical protein
LREISDETAGEIVERLNRLEESVCCISEDHDSHFEEADDNRADIAEIRRLLMLV